MTLIRGDRIIELRKAKQLKQKDLADLLDVSANVVSRYELGKNEPSVEVLVKLADILDTSTDYLLGITHSPDKKPFNDLPELEHDVLQLIHGQDDTFLRKLIVVLKALILNTQN